MEARRGTSDATPVKVTDRALLRTPPKRRVIELPDGGNAPRKLPRITDEHACELLRNISPELRRSNFELKKRITELESDLEMMSPALAKSLSKNGLLQDQSAKQLTEEVNNLKIEKVKIMEGAVNAIM
ncbi:unnamed protein product [Sphagnum balticum]